MKRNYLTGFILTTILFFFMMPVAYSDEIKTSVEIAPDEETIGDVIVLYDDKNESQSNQLPLDRKTSEERICRLLEQERGLIILIAIILVIQTFFSTLTILVIMENFNRKR